MVVLGGSSSGRARMGSLMAGGGAEMLKGTEVIGFLIRILPSLYLSLPPLSFLPRYNLS